MLLPRPRSCGREMLGAPCWSFWGTDPWGTCDTHAGQSSSPSCGACQVLTVNPELWSLVAGHLAFPWLFWSCTPWGPSSVCAAPLPASPGPTPAFSCSLLAGSPYPPSPTCWYKNFKDRLWENDPCSCAKTLTSHGGSKGTELITAQFSDIDIFLG